MKSVTLICLISHPSVDPESVSQQLDLEPYIVQTAGSEIVTPKGRPVGGAYAESKWGYKIDVAEIGDLHGRLSELTERLYAAKQFIRKISAGGGRVRVFLNLPKPSSFAFEAKPETLKKLAELRVHFGFEIFQ